MITVRKLAVGIEKRLARAPEDALEDAHVVMNYFGFEDTIIDNRVEPEDRKLFYALQEVGILHSYWETVPLLDGRHWRIFYWQLDEKVLESLARGEEAPTEEHLYQTLPAEAWSHPPAAM